MMLTTTICSTLADTAANWQQVANGDVVIPKWMAVAAGIILGITALLGLASTRLIPMAFKVIRQVQDGLRDVQQNAAVAKADAQAAKAVAVVQGERVTNLAKATINMAQSSPAPADADALRQSALVHAQAALTCPPPTPAAPPTPEQS